MYLLFAECTVTMYEQILYKPVPASLSAEVPVWRRLWGRVRDDT